MYILAIAERLGLARCHVTRMLLARICVMKGDVTRMLLAHVTRMLLALLFGLTWKLLACYSPGFGVGDSRSFCQFLLNLLDGLQFSLKIVFQSWKRDFRSQDLAGLGRFLSDFFPFLIFCLFLVRFPFISCFSFFFCQIFVKNNGNEQESAESWQNRWEVFDARIWPCKFFREFGPHSCKVLEAAM